MKKFSLIALFAVICTLIYAQPDNKIVAFGKFKVEYGDLSQTSITVFRDGKKFDETSPDKSGKFSFLLDLNHQYQFYFAKPHYVTKIVNFNTSVPAAVLSSPDFIPFPDFDFFVTLFESYPEVDTMFFRNPVGKIQYTAGKNDFDWDKDYTLEIQRHMDEIESDIRDKRKRKIKEDEQRKIDAEAKAIADEEARVQAEKQAALEKEQREKEAKAKAVAEEEARKAAEKQTALDNQQSEKEAKEKAIAEEEARKQAEKQATLEQEKKDKAALEKQKREEEARKLAEKQAQEQAEEAKKEVKPEVNEVKTEPVAEVIPKEEPQKEEIAPKIIAPPAELSVKKEETKVQDIPVQKIQTQAPIPTQAVQSKADVTKMDVAGKTVTRTEIQKGKSTYIYLKVEYTWGGRFFFIQDETNTFRNISESYYNLMTRNK